MRLYVCVCVCVCTEREEREGNKLYIASGWPRSKRRQRQRRRRRRQQETRARESVRKKKNVVAEADDVLIAEGCLAVDNMAGGGRGGRVTALARANEMRMTIMLLY